MRFFATVPFLVTVGLAVSGVASGIPAEGGVRGDKETDGDMGTMWGRGSGSKSKSGSASGKNGKDQCSASKQCKVPLEKPCITIVLFCARNGNCGVSEGSYLQFVALDEIPDGTTISFTDYGWKKDDAGFLTLESSDSPVEWTADGDIAPGTVQEVTLRQLNAQGDQIFAFQGPIDCPVFLYGLNWNEARRWQKDASDNRSSSLPSQLEYTSKEAAIGIGPDAGGDTFVNGYYTGSMTGTKEEILYAIQNPYNWVVSEADAAPPAVADFNVRPCIAIVRINKDSTDNKKEIDVVALNGIKSGTPISFTDFGWKANGGFNMNQADDKSRTWTADADYSPGDVINLKDTNFDAPNPSPGLLQKTNFNNDQLFAFQGDIMMSPTLLYGINFGKDGDEVWDDDAFDGDNGSSALPSELAENMSVVVGGKTNNNYKYIGPLCGTKEELLAKISNTNNWRRSGANLDDPVQSFNVVTETHHH